MRVELSISLLENLQFLYQFSYTAHDYKKLTFAPNFKYVDFTELNLNNSILRAIEEVGYVSATPIQEKAIPVVMSGKDMIGIAQTGTGKTAAFILPILQKILDKGYNNTSTLIIVPTRELALQIEGVFKKMGTNLKITCCYGGHKREIEENNLKTDDKFLKYKDRLDHELKIIIEMKYPSYFLIVSDYIKWAKNNDIPVGPGRGSGAGSLVAWTVFQPW